MQRYQLDLNPCYYVIQATRQLQVCVTLLKVDVTCVLQKTAQSSKKTILKSDEREKCALVFVLNNVNRNLVLYALKISRIIQSDLCRIRDPLWLITWIVLPTFKSMQMIEVAGVVREFTDTGKIVAFQISSPLLHIVLFITN